MSNLATSVGKNLFRLGDTGPVVRAIQLELAALGYKLRGTGYFGGATETAVESFQRIAGLDVDGVVGPKTARAIDAARDAGSRRVLSRDAAAEVSLPLWHTYGLTKINVRETPGAGDTLEILEWARGEGGAIARDYKHDSTAWCALFANHILTKVGLRGTETLWALDFGDQKKWPCLRLDGPAVGAFAPMPRFNAAGKLIGGHIITIAGRDQHGNVMGLGGNQGDEVSIRPFPPKRLDRSFFWPAGVSLPSTVGFGTLPIVRSDGRLSSAEA